MAEYIEREAIKSKKVYSEERHEYVVPVAEIDWMVSADVAPVRHGRWVKEKRDVLVHWHCSVCKNCYYLEEPNANYCPNCGAKNGR